MFEQRDQENTTDQLKRIATYINKLGFADVKEEDLGILMECLDKNKDG